MGLSLEEINLTRRINKHGLNSRARKSINRGPKKGVAWMPSSKSGTKLPMILRAVDETERLDQLISLLPL